MIPTQQSIEADALAEELRLLQSSIIKEFESLEAGNQFDQQEWSYDRGEGGGRRAILRGQVFEKCAVHFSYIKGNQFPASDAEGPFSATGVSLITHMRNPHAPTVHMNIRYIEAGGKRWFGGGYDLTPMGFAYEEDTEYFHAVAKRTLDAIDSSLYPNFMQQAKEYFYLPHRGKERGVGGIFFDHYWTGNEDQDYKMWKSVGESFTETIMPIYKKRIHTPYEEKDRALQSKLRGHYAEFNLLYDRGTKFGLSSGGNVEAILSSLPPLASWN